MSGKGGERGGCHGRIVILFFIEFTPAISFFNLLLLLYFINLKSP
jgi:hypothetical protein